MCNLASIMPSVEHINDNLAGLFCEPEIHLLLCSSTTQEAAAAEATATEFERRKKSLACDVCAVWFQTKCIGLLLCLLLHHPVTLLLSSKFVKRTPIYGHKINQAVSLRKKTNRGCQERKNL